MMKYIKPLYNTLFPMFSVFIIVLYFRLLNYLNFNNILPSLLILFLFIPAAYFEVFVSSRIKRKSIKTLLKDKKQIFYLITRLLFWFVLFLLWVLAMADEGVVSRDYAEFINFSFYPMLAMVYMAGSYLTGVAFVIWIGLYYWLTVRKKVFRIFTSLILPGILSYMIFHHYYYLGGVGRRSERAIIAQPGVDVFYSAADFPKRNYSHHDVWIKEGRFAPRDVYVDSDAGAVFANYASTYGPSSALKTPSLLRIDLDTKETEYYVSYFARAFGVTPESVIISPWFDFKIYELDKNDLSLIRTMPVKTDMEYWEVLSVLYANENIYIATDLSATLHKFDYSTGEIEEVFRPEVAYGGCLWNVKYSEKRHKIYLTEFGGDYDIYELDPDTLEVERALSLGSPGASGLLLDDENNMLYMQCGGSNKLYEVNIDDFSLNRILKGKVHARRMHLDSKRNLLYILSYFYGTFSAIDIDSGQELWKVNVGGKSYGLDVQDDTAYINSMTGIVTVDLNKMNSMP